MHSQLYSAYQLTKMSHLSQKQIYDDKCNGEQFRKGDRVWQYNHAVQKGRTKTFTSLRRVPLCKYMCDDYYVQIPSKWCRWGPVWFSQLDSWPWLSQWGLRLVWWWVSLTIITLSNPIVDVTLISMPIISFLHLNCFTHAWLIVQGGKNNIINMKALLTMCVSTHLMNLEILGIQHHLSKNISWVQEQNHVVHAPPLEFWSTLTIQHLELVGRLISKSSDNCTDSSFGRALDMASAFVWSFPGLYTIVR